jgi:hypothetical protein
MGRAPPGGRPHAFVVVPLLERRRRPGPAPVEQAQRAVDPGALDVVAFPRGEPQRGVEPRRSAAPRCRRAWRPMALTRAAGSAGTAGSGMAGLLPGWREVSP